MSRRIYLSPSDQNRNIYAYGDTNEMEQCRRIGDAAEAALKRCGFAVINNQTDTMEQRVAQSNTWDADMHIAIHTNAFNGQVGGTRVFYYTENGYGNVAARAVYDRLSPVTPGPSDNIRPYPGLYELRMTTATAVYVEAEFHDVPEYARWIIEHPAEIAEAICRGVCDYYDVPYTPPAPQDGEENGVLYRVQVGSFAVRKNAERFRDELKSRGYGDAFIVEVKK